MDHWGPNFYSRCRIEARIKPHRRVSDALSTCETAQTASKSAIYWLVGNGFDTMYSLWNPGSQPQDLLLTFRYGVGQTYEHPVHLEPSGTAMIDIMQLAEMGMPDRNGQVLPLSATEGSLIVIAGNGSRIRLD